MIENAISVPQVHKRLSTGGEHFSYPLISQAHDNSTRLKPVSTIDFHITARCSQACPYCWGPRRFRDPVDTRIARHIIARIQELGVRRIVFTGGDPLQRLDAPDLVRFAKQIGLETALSTTGDFITREILENLSPYLDLISLPLDGSTDEINARTKHPGHFQAVMQALDWLRRYPNIDVKVCTPVNRHNLNDIPAIALLVERYSRSTLARVFYNVFQAFPRAMFSVKWENLVVSDDEFSNLKKQVGENLNIRINYLSHEILDRLYVMVFPNGDIIIPRGSEYLNYGAFLEVKDFKQVLQDSQFDSDKHLRHSHGWEKELCPPQQVENASRGESLDILNV